MNYLIEIRARFFLLLLSIIFTFSVLYFYKEAFLFVLIKASYLGSSKSTQSYFIFTNADEMFYLYFDLLNFGSLQLCVLFLIHHFFLFIAPGLFFKEFRRSVYFLKNFFLLWFVLLNFLNLFVVPVFWDFFLSFNDVNIFSSVNVYFEAKISEYLIFYKNIYYLALFYLVFFALGLFFFYNIFSDLHLVKSFRKIAHFFFIFMSTTLSPPDIFSQILISFFCICFYELLFFNCLLKHCAKQVTS